MIKYKKQKQRENNIMPTNSNTNETTMRIRANTSDQNLVRLAHRIAVAYGDDKVHLLSSREVEQVKTGNVDIALKVLSKVPQMSAGQRLDFCDLFIGEDMSGLDFATPAILGDAYRAISDRVYNGESEQQERLDKLAARIDDLSADFANSGGMVVSQNEWPLVDTNNVADVYGIYNLKGFKDSDSHPNRIHRGTKLGIQLPKDFEEQLSFDVEYVDRPLFIDYIVIHLRDKESRFDDKL